MVDRKIIEQLDSPLAEKRKIAIQQLARTKDMEAIRYLEAVERLDADATIRDIAKKAIAYIQRHNEGQAEVIPPLITPDPKPAPKSRYAAGSIMAEYADKQPDPDEAPPPFELTEQPQLVEISESRRKNAKSAVNMAGRAAFEEQNGRAAKYLVDAFKLDPNLKHDAYAVGLAATVTGLYKNDAINAIIDGSALELFDKKELTGKPKPKKEALEAEEDQVPATWGTAIIDLLLYGLINAVIVGVATILLINFIISSINNDPQMQEQLALSGGTAVVFADLLSQVAIVAMVMYSLLYGFLSMIGLLITSFFIHVASRMILGGDGTMANLIHRTALFLGVMAAMLAVSQIGAFFLPIVTDSTLGILIYAASLFFSVWTLIGYSSRIGKAYDFGAGKGCAAVFLSAVFFAIAGIVCFAVLGQAFISQIDSIVATQAAQGGMFTVITPAP